MLGVLRAIFILKNPTSKTLTFFVEFGGFLSGFLLAVCFSIRVEGLVEGLLGAGRVCYLLLEIHQFEKVLTANAMNELLYLLYIGDVEALAHLIYLRFKVSKAVV
jgi:hypothetical protein